MPDKDPNNTAYIAEWLRHFMPHLSTFFLSTLGGVVNHIMKLRNGKRKFKFKELIFDLVVSIFAGLITFYFCLALGVSETMSAVLIAISGHMGTRAIAGFETIYRRAIGVKENERN
jgi:uncharacterized membrane protein HdeD (DUF308 family)